MRTMTNHIYYNITVQLISSTCLLEYCALVTVENSGQNKEGVYHILHMIDDLKQSA